MPSDLTADQLFFCAHVEQDLGRNPVLDVLFGRRLGQHPSESEIADTRQVQVYLTYEFKALEGYPDAAITSRDFGSLREFFAAVEVEPLFEVASEEDPVNWNVGIDDDAPREG